MYMCPYLLIWCPIVPHYKTLEAIIFLTLANNLNMLHECPIVQQVHIFLICPNNNKNIRTFLHILNNIVSHCPTNLISNVNVPILINLVSHSPTLQEMGSDHFSYLSKLSELVTRLSHCSTGTYIFNMQ